MHNKWRMQNFIQKKKNQKNPPKTPWNHYSTQQILSYDFPTKKTWWHIIAQLLSLFCLSLFCYSEISFCSSSSFSASERWCKLIPQLRIHYADSSFSCWPFNTHLFIFKDSFNITFAVEAFPSFSCDNYPSISLGFCMWTMGIIMESASLCEDQRDTCKVLNTMPGCEHLLDVDN